MSPPVLRGVRRGCDSAVAHRGDLYSLNSAR
jgi:hypothetical protein